MADTNLPNTLDQNPAPFPEEGQGFQTKLQAQVDAIMAAFLKVLPSNYVAQTNGPFYTLQFQALAEQIARIQIVAQEVFKDSTFEYTRTEFLWEIIGSLVFPGATQENGEVPVVSNDVSYREFLQRMVILLLQGATKDTVKEGAGLLADSDVVVAVVEKFLGARNPGSAWGIDNQFEFEINVERADGTQFPSDPFILQENVRLILEALKPAHALYEYRHLFREAFGDIFTDSASWELEEFYYDDLRSYWMGAKEVSGSLGQTLTDRTLFTDVTRSFASLRVGAVLTITSGANEGTYTVTDMLFFPVGADSTARAYTTSPTGLSGTATVSADGIITDSTQDFGACEEGETLTFTAGSNVGAYRLDVLLGSNGGPVGAATGPATEVRAAPCVLRVNRRMPQVLSGQSYTVTVDRLGRQETRTVTDEDVANQFYI